MRTTCLGIVLVVLAGCGGEVQREPEAPPTRYFSGGPSPIDFSKLVNEAPSPSGGAANDNDERFHDLLKEAAAVYAKTYGNVDDAMRWAPTLCSRPPSSTIRESASEDEGTHGRKLYWLYAKDRPAYLKTAQGAEQPVGQAIVKEAFVAEPGRGDGDPQQSQWAPFVTTIERDGAIFHAGEKEALYILLKLDPTTEGTDEGWVYGTLTPDGATVTSAGRVASCMACHTEGTTDRMFGLAAE